MTRTPSTNICTLSIAPTTRGFGFAVIDGEGMLVNWGGKVVKGDKNKGALKKTEELISHYEPGTIVLQDASAKHSRRSQRVRELTQQIATMATARKLKVKLYSDVKIRRAYFRDGKGTKHGIAEIVAKRFPEELGTHVPPKRRPWMSEDYQMSIFEAVALALMPRLGELSLLEVFKAPQLDRQI